ncbi:3-hydroxyacyl-CoA dehydrogenase NAD-binding domain-containing protein [Bradyrhizobium sp. CCGE-LA001]|uniref:3-hydroxyacyl-CoA dehydrogenase NAD-binding domain-containing protein n=1 Tax=Bradyrhizobium sp. CCGE-LA001 TaxID=1223566 RepID=UPI00031AD022|nr:3-hydroxyacyl-CoA dehydrogenase NAD-binding domain-containing protein [Bradyrhizobium sp. CCGE-LA001]AMA59990.1 3-hydroxyacyl-CoA dehydrogenase [Bradyrhizobium sp. CCGE-LA001]
MSLKNFQVEVDSDGIALVTWNNHDRSMNVLDETSTSELEQIVRTIIANASVKGVVVTSGKETFCAGSDLSMLESINREYVRLTRDEGEIAANQMLFNRGRQLSLTFRSIETSGKAWVAAVNGTAFGGGLELTLCCHYRVAADNPVTQVGFPEIKIGLLQGAGGTQRVPRLVALEDAIQILLKGQPVNLARAKALKLIDAVVPAADLIKAAKDWIKEGGEAVSPWDKQGFKLPKGPIYSPAGKSALRTANALYRRDTYDNYPASRAVMSCVYEGLQLPIDAALRVESRYFTSVLRSKEARAMIRTQISMRELEKGRCRPHDVPPSKVKKLAVIGAGFMGASIGYVSARAGIEVVLITRHQQSANNAKAYAKSAFDDQIRKGHANENERDETLSRITATNDYAALPQCDLVIESVFEDRKSKADVYAKAQPLLKDGAIFASNTSSLPINSLAETFRNRSIFIGLHFFSPTEKMRLVEVILGKNTGKLALATALDYVAQIGKIPILVKDSRGFFANRCVRRYVSEGIEMFLEGVPPAAIENCAKMAGMPIGPLSLADEVALDLRLQIMKATEADLGPNAIDAGQKKLMVELVENQGRFGRKNGRGFYDYPEKGRGKKHLWQGLANLQPKHIDNNRLDTGELCQRFLIVQSVEAARAIDERIIADPRDADVGSILGFGYPPFTGGVLSYIDLIGADKFVERCHKLEETYGNRFTPPQLLENMAKNSESFYQLT